MRDILVFSATGLGQGAVFAALALGLLVTFKEIGRASCRERVL